ncbi:FKBP-type peptidyl-prolyl cis-trans isomerase [Sphingomonas sp. RHCKR47]|uniref:FKBP-type peptidyl-prolyl cis-trans isomerase n=1 Tax=Sphingomonas citricola TaxID=2862498 RepID=UPI001CA4F993|nr:FKBP-type peptidyl-prolyl cis-trans isomerase [Sphingomonas citricola]MBW6523720.1 FKBP-type peptidyl-prolyl cis-trans isomerase [Sphingomonas citricola]
MSTVTAVPIAPIKRAYVLWLWIGLALALVAGVALAQAGATGIATTPSGLRYKVMKQGTGPHPTDSDVALVRYEGRLMNGTVFDKADQPTALPVARMIPGFTEGLKLMSKGAKYRFWIKPELAYGAEDKGPIPANSTLQFDVELVDFMSEQQIRAMQQMMMQQGAMPGGAAAPAGDPQGR